MSKKICFFITPIGAIESVARKRCDDVQNFILEPAIGRLFEIKRSDDLAEAGQISSQIFVLLEQSDLVVADLTDLNPNVMYELGVRHASSKPSIQIMDSKGRLPFDIAGERTIFFDISDLKSVDYCKNSISKFVGKIFIENNSYLSPVASAIGGANFFSPNIVDILKDIKESVSSIESDVWSMDMETSGLDMRLDKIESSIDDLSDKIDKG